MTYPTETLETYGRFAVGDAVRVPGHRRSDPETLGTLAGIERVTFARSQGVFAVVASEDGREVRCAIGILLPRR